MQCDDERKEKRVTFKGSSPAKIQQEALQRVELRSGGRLSVSNITDLRRLSDQSDYIPSFALPNRQIKTAEPSEDTTMRKSRNLEYRVMRSDNIVSGYSGGHRKLRSASFDHQMSPIGGSAPAREPVYMISSSNFDRQTASADANFVEAQPPVYHEIRTQPKIGVRKASGMPRHIIPQSDILTMKSPPSSHSHNDLDWIYTDNLDNDNHKDLENKTNESSAARSAKTEQKKRHVFLPSSNSLEVLEDLDINEAASSYVPSVSNPRRSQVKGRRLDIDEIKHLKLLIFGATNRAYPDSWKRQSFVFEMKHDLRFGLIQNSGGPCGVLAVIQAFVINILINGCALFKVKKAENALCPTEEERRKALVTAITLIIHRAHNSKESPFIVCLTDNKSSASNNPLLCDGVTEYITVHQLTTLTQLRCFVQDNLNFYLATGGTGSMLAVVYSVILSRGIEKIKEDFDSPDICLLSQLFYCNQELVNLLLTGRACSNGFNNTKELPGGLILKGIHTENEIGLLSLFEFYKSCEIGSYLKSPKSNIWVICSESHFSVLFSSHDKINEEEKFDMYYYDGLAKQDSIIKTKWRDFSIDWNGSERLL